MQCERSHRTLLQPSCRFDHGDHGYPVPPHRREGVDGDLGEDEAIKPKVSDGVQVLLKKTTLKAVHANEETRRRQRGGKQFRDEGPRVLLLRGGNRVLEIRDHSVRPERERFASFAASSPGTKIADPNGR